MQAATAALVLLLVVTASVLAGCPGSSGSSAANNPDGGAGGQTGGGGGSTQSGTVSVVMQNMALKPSSPTVSAGATVTWSNEDSTSHTVAFTDPGSVDSGR